MRSDRTALCIACRTRFSRTYGVGCPSCGREESVFDGRSEAQRRTAGRLLARRADAGGRTWIGMDGAAKGTAGQRRAIALLAAVLVVGLFLPWLAARVGASAVLLALGLLAGALILVVWRVGVGVLSAIRGASVPVELAIHTPLPGARSSRAKRIRGRVRVLEGVLSPLGDVPCAAYRLVGRAHGGSVDDTAGGVIEVLRDEGSSAIRVDLAAASVELAVAATPSPLGDGAMSEALAQFLTERWLFPKAGPVRLAEAVLRDGQEVELDAIVEDEQSPSGYRQTRIVPVAHDEPGAEVILRLVGSPRSR